MTLMLLVLCVASVLMLTCVVWLDGDTVLLRRDVDRLVERIRDLEHPKDGGK